MITRSQSHEAVLHRGRDAKAERQIMSDSCEAGDQEAIEAMEEFRVKASHQPKNSLLRTLEIRYAKLIDDLMAEHQAIREREAKGENVNKEREELQRTLNEVVAQIEVFKRKVHGQE
jgi:hypothetical protein